MRRRSPCARRTSPHERAARWPRVTPTLKARASTEAKRGHSAAIFYVVTHGVRSTLSERPGSRTRLGAHHCFRSARGIRREGARARLRVPDHADTIRGVLGAFRELDAAVEAIGALKKLNVDSITVYTPAPRPEFDHALEPPPSPVRRYALVGALCGALLGYWMAIWASEYWPLVVGGKAISTWVPYTIYAFELMVLVGGLSTVAGLFIHARVPRLAMTVGWDPRFSAGHYGVWVQCSPWKLKDVERILRQSGAVDVRGDARPLDRGAIVQG